MEYKQLYILGVVYDVFIIVLMYCNCFKGLFIYSCLYLYIFVYGYDNLVCVILDVLIVFFIVIYYDYLIV